MNTERTTLHVKDMSCEHCVMAIKGAVGDLPGVAGVSVDLREQTVTVEYDLARIPLDEIKSEIEEQGYQVT